MWIFTKPAYTLEILISNNICVPAQIKPSLISGLIWIWIQNYGSTFPSKTTRSSIDINPKIIVHRVYNYQFFALFHHFHWKMPIFVAKLTSSLPKKQQNFAWIHLPRKSKIPYVFFTIVYPLNVHFGVKIQYVAESNSKIVEAHLLPYCL